MKKIIVFILWASTVTATGTAQQSVSINTTGNAADPSAILDVSSNNKGMLIPRMNGTQRRGILNVAVGLMVFDIDTDSFWYYQSTGWTELQSASNNPWQKNGYNINNSNIGNVGIGIDTPSKKLEVNGEIRAHALFIPGGSTGDFLVKNTSDEKVIFKKGFAGTGLNYCIAVEGIYPSRNRVGTGSVPATPLGAEPFIAEIMLFAGNFAPRGYMFCDGSLLPIAQNTALFSLLGTTYGGNGITTFALPDLRDAVPVQAGSNWFLGETSR